MTAKPDGTTADLEQMNQLLHGQRVRDRDSDDESEMVIVEIRRTPAREHYIDAIGMTVAEVNPDYLAHQPVVDVAFVSAIEDALGIDWSADDVLELAADGNLDRARINRYAYPVGRLVPVENSRERHEEGEGR